MYSDDVNIFVACEEPIDVFVRDLERILRIPIQPGVDEQGTLRSKGKPYPYVYDGSDHHIKLLIGHQMTLMNDDDLDFEDYQYRIYCCSLGNLPFPQSAQISHAFARSIFEQLKATNRYRLMLVEDIQTKLDEFVPTHPIDGLPSQP